MDKTTLRDAILKVENLCGWDFSKLNVEEFPAPWVYQEIVKQYIQPGDHVLDIGTGGGEIFLSLADRFAYGTGIDHNPKMIQTVQALKMSPLVKWKPITFISHRNPLT